MPSQIPSSRFRLAVAAVLIAMLSVVGPFGSVTSAHATSASVSATVVSASSSSGLRVSVSGSGIDDPGVYVAMIVKGTEAEVTESSGYAAVNWVNKISSGSFSTTLSAPTSLLDASKRYEILVWKQHTMPTAENIRARTDLAISTANWDAVQGVASSASASKTAKASSSAKASASAKASGTAKASNSASASKTAKASSSAKASASASASSSTRTSSSSPASPASSSAVPSSSAASSASVPVGVAAAPSEVSSAETAGAAIDGAVLTWGVKESFRGYIDGSIANGSWSEEGNASYATPSFSWSGGTGAVDPAASTGALSFTGSVHFTGHGGVLDMTLANPTVEIEDASTAYLLLDVRNTTMDGVAVDEKQVRFVKLDLTGTSLDAVDGRVSLDAVPATLTADGAAAFGTYPEGETFDPVSVSFAVGADYAALDGASDAGSTASLIPAVLGVVAVLLILAATGLVLVRVRARRADGSAKR